MKKQTEFTGTERPTIPELDEVGMELFEIDKELKIMRERRQIINDSICEKMTDYESELERNQKGELVYMFCDGDRTFFFAVCKQGTDRARVEAK